VELLAASGVSRFVILLPALIVGAGLVGAVFILLGRAFVDTVRESSHPRLILAGLLALTGAVLLLTWLGVDLPKE
jgi:hypothetical protein